MQNRLEQLGYEAQEITYLMRFTNTYREKFLALHDKLNAVVHTKNHANKINAVMLQISSEENLDKVSNAFDKIKEYFTVGQITNMFVRNTALEIINQLRTIEDNYDNLIKDKLTHEQIYFVTTLNRGADAIGKLATNYKKFSSFGFTYDHMVTILMGDQRNKVINIIKI